MRERRTTPDTKKGEGAKAGREKEAEQSAVAVGGSAGGAVREGVGAEIGGGAEVESGETVEEGGGVGRLHRHLGLRR